MKFGGTSVADGERIAHVANLAKSYFDKGNEVAIITSALGGVTDALLDCASVASGNGTVLHIHEVMIDISKKHYEAAHIAIGNEVEKREIINKVLSYIDGRMDELEKALIGICYLGELTQRSIDYISSFGERLCAPILSGAIEAIGVQSRSFTGGEAGIVTDDVFGNAKPLDESYSNIADCIKPLMVDSIPVITGFIGENKSGIITTLGRGGSDFSAAIVGAAVGADEIWLWKEVHGILTTDPRIVPTARTIPVMSYIEAMELSYFGAKVLHPRTIEPAIKHGIPVRVKNTFEPEFSGTLIVKDAAPTKEVVKAVTLIRNAATINICGAGMIGTIGVAARTFSALADAGVNIVMISQGSSEANLSMVVIESQVQLAIHALEAEFTNGVVGEISSDIDICVVAAVGAGMAGIPGVAGRVFNAIGKSGVNIIMISQGSSQHNISFVVSTTNAEDAVRALHTEFELDKVQK